MRTLGSGLSGEVLAVEDHEGKKALKFLKRVQMNVSREEALTNFKNEFSILSELNHPGIARILDFGFDAQVNKYYFTTELISGADFFQATEGMPLATVEEMAVQVLRALNYLHARGVYHFDIKPQNILVNLGDGSMRPKIIDFGLAGFSTPRKKVGTPAYMAPEVFLGGQLDGRTDLYSFGVLLYKTLTRQNPFASKEVRETLMRHKNLTPDPPSVVNPALPKYWDRIIMRLIDKTPSDRYPDGSTVIRDINFLANKHYEIETQDTRLSYLPEKGTLIGRKKVTEIFRSLFDMIFITKGANPSKLLIIEGREGTGKTRLLSEFKYYSQLKEVPVYTLNQVTDGLKPPFLLEIDTDGAITPEQVTRVLQQYANQDIMVLWATGVAPTGWSDCELITLHNYTEEELTEYLTEVTGQKDPPKILIKEIYQRSDGNPLFVSEIIKTLLANNMLLDSSGRWASSSFEDLGINFEKIQIPKTLSGLLGQKYHALDVGSRQILEWLAICNQPLSLLALTELTGDQQLQAAILNLTKEDMIERTDRELRYFFTNVLLRDTVYSQLQTPQKQGMHDRAARYFAEGKADPEVVHYHYARGTDSQVAIESLYFLSERAKERGKLNESSDRLNEAWERAEQLDAQKKIAVEARLAEALIEARDFKRALNHYQHLREFYDHDAHYRDQLSDKIRIYERLGDLHAKLNQYEAARRYFETALQWVGEGSANRTRQMVIENHIANVYMKSGELDRAKNVYQRNYEIWEQEFSLEEKTKVTNNWLADVWNIEKNYPALLEHVEKDLKFYAQINNRFLLARSHYLKGSALLAQVINSKGEEKVKKREAAIKAFEACLTLSKQIEAGDLLLRAYNEMGNLHFYEHEMTASVQELDGASEYYKRALAMAQKIDDLQTAAAIASNLANIYRRKQAHRDAYPYYIYAINTLESIEPKTPHNYWHLFNSFADVAISYLHLNEVPRAEEALNRAEELMRTHEHLAIYECYIWLRRARIYYKQGQRALFKRCYEQAKSMASHEMEIQELKEFEDELKLEGQLEITNPTAASPRTFKPMNDKPHEISVEQLETILKINKYLNAEHSLEHLLKMVLNYALDLSGAESGLVLLVNEAGELSVEASVNTTVDSELKRISTSAAREALNSGNTIVSHDALTDGRFDSADSIVLNELKSILCLPLRSRNKVIGVLYLDNRMQTDAFKDVNLRVLNAYCDQVGIAVENARLFGRYEHAEKRLQEQLEKTTGELNEAREQLKSDAGTYMAKYSYSQIVAKSKPMQDIFRMLDKITETNLSIFIHGASGTGKELIARAIHFNNPTRFQKRFVAINCGAIPSNLIESELFGHKAGSFTGADRDKKGLFEEANGGSLFLDEIAELEPQLQVKLLRVLQEGEVQRVGDVRPIKVDVRIVSASHKSIENLIKQGAFREDLFYRLCQIKLDIPPLGDRREDVPLLVEHFIEKFKKEHKLKDAIHVTPTLMKILLNYNWPGNVRELENVINVACALRNGSYLDENCLPPNYGIAEVSRSLSLAAGDGHGPVVSIDEHNKLNPMRTWDEYETLIIAKCFQTNHFKKGSTAEMLGISPSTLYKKLKEHNLEDKNNPIYSDNFVYAEGTPLKDYIPKIFKAALEQADNHPYAAIRKLGVSQGYFYKVMKTFS